MNILKVFSAVAATTAFALTYAGTPLVAQAGHLGCGDIILTDETLDADLTCPGDGLSIGANRVTLDLGGFTLSGSPNAGFGIDISNAKHVTIRNGNIDGFLIGVVVSESREINLSHLVFTGQTDDSRNGVGIWDSRDVLIEHSVFLNTAGVTNPDDQEPTGVTANAPLDSVSRDIVVNNVHISGYKQGVNFQPATTGKISNSTFAGNLIAAFVHNESDLTISANDMSGCLVVTNFDCIGIAVAESQAGAPVGIKIENNYIHDTEHGILMFSATNVLVSGNHVRNNTFTGIGLGGVSRHNRILSNITAGSSTDLFHDVGSSPNIWEGNSCDTWFGADIPDC